MHRTPSAWIHALKTELTTPAWKRSLILWLALNLLLTSMGVLAWRLHSPIRPQDLSNLQGIAPIDEGLPGALEGVWLRWDAVHYYHIAQEGYNTEVVSAFFPLYPLLGRAVGGLLGGDELAGLLLVSRLALLLALVIMYQLAAEHFGDQAATFAIVFTALYPMGVYWFAPYPLSLAMLFTLLSLRWAMQKHWLLAALAGLAAGLTHGTTVPLALGLLAAWFIKVRKERRAWLLLPAVAAPLLGTLLFFSWRMYAGFPAMDELLGRVWLRVMQPPWMIVSDFQRFFLNYGNHLDGWINLVLFLLGAGMTVVCIRKLPAPLWLYQISLVVYICSTANYATPFGSYGRYLMMAFPAFITLPLIVRGKVSRMATLVICFLSMLFLAVVYLEWGWLA